MFISSQHYRTRFGAGVRIWQLIIYLNSNEIFTGFKYFPGRMTPECFYKLFFFKTFDFLVMLFLGQRMKGEFSNVNKTGYRIQVYCIKVDVIFSQTVSATKCIHSDN